MRAVFTMFIIFSKNLDAGENSKIHKKQKLLVQLKSYLQSNIYLCI